MPKLTLRQRGLLLGVLGLASVAAFQNCSSPTVGAVGSSLKSQGLVLSPASLTIGGTKSQTFQATGGNGKYTFTVGSDCGVMLPNGAYTAPSYPTQCMVQAMDSAGATGVAVVTVTNSNLLNATYVATSSNGVLTAVLSATGGSGHYTYQQMTGSGTLAGNVYTTSVADEIADVLVSDGSATTHAVISSLNLVPAVQTIYRLYFPGQNDHMMSSNPSEDARYSVDGGTYQFFTKGGGNRILVARCFYGNVDIANRTHALTVSMNCGNGNVEGGMGYLENSPTSYAPNALYQCAGANNRYIATKNTAECSGSFSNPQVLGYIP